MSGARAERQLNIRVPERMHEQLRIRAAKADRTITAETRRALRAWLAEDPADREAEVAA